MTKPRLAGWLPLLLLSLTACRERTAARAEGEPPANGPETAAALVIREAAVVAFWLPASDTLALGEGADLLDDFRVYTRQVGPFLDDRGIPLLATNAESLLVERADGLVRVVMLSGLDFPFGYVLVEPGYAESILTGVSSQEELLEQVDWYFGFAEEDGPVEGRRQVVLRGR